MLWLWELDCCPFTAARGVFKHRMKNMASPRRWSRSGRGAGVQLQNGSVGNACSASSTRHEAQA